MLRLLTLPVLSLALMVSVVSYAVAKPCDGNSGADLEQLLPLARVALDLPGTDQVAIDPSRRCIGIQVRSWGTARLVKLLLRGVRVPRETVDLRVVEPASTGA